MSTDLLWLCTLAVFVLPVYCQTGNPVEGELDSAANTTGTRSAPTLQFVIVVSRHGNRAPVFDFPSSPYQSDDTNMWPNGNGELTQSGYDQMYKLGKKVRALYDGFLDQTFRPEDFKALSSTSGRTLQSAELFLAGLFPPRGFQIWNKDLLWQPVPVHPTFLDHYELVFLNEKPLCSRFREAQEDALMETENLNNSSLVSFIDYVLPFTGIDENKLHVEIGSAYKAQIVFIVWEAIINAVNNGIPLTEWASKLYPEPLTSLVEKFYYASAVGSLDQIKYLEGEMFQEMVRLMQSKANGTLSPDTRMYFYSGHDCTIMGLMMMMLKNVEDKIGFVNTGSALIYELHQDPQSGSFYVQVLYIDGASPNLEPSAVNIPSCGSPCDLHQLLNITEEYYNITDWEEECHVIPPMPSLGEEEESKERNLTNEILEIGLVFP
uniref:acid phosphatase n=1 Tax=Graphocephala atropunctata TaxID=36148 RepID=A0A1B6LPF6_9HEMI